MPPTGSTRPLSVNSPAQSATNAFTQQVSTQANCSHHCSGSIFVASGSYGFECRSSTTSWGMTRSAERVGTRGSNRMPDMASDNVNLRQGIDTALPSQTDRQIMLCTALEQSIELTNFPAACTAIAYASDCRYASPIGAHTGMQTGAGTE